MQLERRRSQEVTLAVTYSWHFRASPRRKRRKITSVRALLNRGRE
jgi:hypothetical protein